LEYIYLPLLAGSHICTQPSRQPTRSEISCGSRPCYSAICLFFLRCAVCSRAFRWVPPPIKHFPAGEDPPPHLSKILFLSPMRLFNTLFSFPQDHRVGLDTSCLGCPRRMFFPLSSDAGKAPLPHDLALFFRQLTGGQKFHLFLCRYYG